MSGSSSEDEHECECEHAHDEPWLVSYADMMTLLFGFFVIMYAFAAAKLEKMVEVDEDIIPMRREIAAYFGGQYVTPLKEVEQKFKAAMGGENLKEKVKMLLKPEGLDITFNSNVLFDSGKAVIHPQTKKALEFLAKLILLEKEKYRVIVEGHTDDAPINTYRYPSNWELSGARASAVIRLFEENGFNSGSLLAIGYGSSRPQFPNRTPEGSKITENMARNRRIRLKISLLEDGLDLSNVKNTDDLYPPIPNSNQEQDQPIYGPLEEHEAKKIR